MTIRERLLSQSFLDEGPTWEAAMSAAHWKLDNLVVLYEGLHTYGGMAGRIAWYGRSSSDLPARKFSPISTGA